jgi:hypothetical protein
VAEAEDAMMIDAQRKRFDVREHALQHDVDADRDALRAVHDRTRSHLRGDEQSHRSLERERHSADEAVVAERGLSTLLRDAERSLADRSMRLAEKARASADEATAARGQALHDAVVAARAQAALVTVTARGLLEDGARPRIEALILAAEQLGETLSAALDPFDSRCLHHDVGGSG